MEELNEGKTSNMEEKPPMEVIRRPSKEAFDQLDLCIKAHGAFKNAFEKYIKICLDDSFTYVQINFWARDYFKAKKVSESTSLRIRQDLVKIVKKETKDLELEAIDKMLDTQIKTDLQIMKSLKWPVRPYDVWSFQSADKRFGLEYATRMPAQIVANALYFFTEQGDTIIDPMAGGGVVGDVCKRMQRLCKMYDVNPIREDVHKLDITQGFPDIEADLVFWDPPYYKKIDYGPDSISMRPKDQFLNVFKKAAKEIQSKRIALLVSDYDDEYNNNSQDNVFIHDYINQFDDWRVLRIIQCPLTTEQIRASQYYNYVKNKKLFRLGRYLVIFQHA
jgi:DNA modification methylase